VSEKPPKYEPGDGAVSVPPRRRTSLEDAPPRVSGTGRDHAILRMARGSVHLPFRATLRPELPATARRRLELWRKAKPAILRHVAE